MTAVENAIENSERDIKTVENNSNLQFTNRVYKTIRSIKIMMKMFIKMLKAKKDKTEEEQEMIKIISKSYDISDRKYIEPILKCLKK